jgi:hypothetical protein
VSMSRSQVTGRGAPAALTKPWRLIEARAVCPFVPKALERPRKPPGTTIMAKRPEPACFRKPTSKARKRQQWPIIVHTSVYLPEPMYEGIT